MVAYNKIFALAVDVPNPSLPFYEGGANKVYIAPETGTGGGAGTAGDPLDAMPTTLIQGTEYILKGGETYSSQIDIAQSGIVGQKIILDGNSLGTFGTGKAIIEPMADMTGWAADGTINGNSVYTTTAPTGKDVEGYTILQGGTRTRLAQDVGANNMYEVHDVANFHTGTGTQTDLETNRLLSSPVFSALSSTPVGSSLFFWIDGNRVEAREITAWDGADEVTFDTAITSITSVPTGSFALLNHPDCLTTQGEYLLIGADITMYPYSDPTVTLPRVAVLNSYGVNVTGDYISVRNLNVRGTDLAGIHLNGVNEGRVIDNDVSDCGDANSHPIFVTAASTNCQILQNDVADSVHGFGIIASSSSDIFIDDNDATQCNRTAIYASGSTDVAIRGNRVGDRIGVHGNGIATYTNVSGIKVLDNDVIMPGGGICYAHETTAGTVVAGNVFLGSNIPGEGAQLVDFHQDNASQGGHTLTANTWYINSGDLGKALSMNGTDGNVRIGTVIAGNLGDGLGAEPTAGGQTLTRFDDCGFTSNSGFPHTDLDLTSYGMIDLQSDRATIWNDPANGDFSLTAAGQTLVASQVSPAVSAEGVSVTWLGAYDPATNTKPFSGWKSSRGYN